MQVPGLQINSRWRLCSKVVIQVGLALPLLSASAVAFDQSTAGAFIAESYESLRLSLQGLEDSKGPQVESQSESISKFRAKFSVVDMDKESKKLHFGLLSVTTSYTNSKALFGAGPPTETQQDQTIALDLTGLRNLWSLSPSAVYVNSFVKQTPYQTISFEGTDRTTGISAGASWGWNGGNADVGYWNYSLDSRPTGQPYNSTGRGFDASLGAYVNAIGFYAGYSYSETEDLAAFSNAITRGQDTYASVSYKPARYLPDIVVTGSFGRYEYNNFVYGITDDATYWSATLGFDFSKFLLSPLETKPLSTKLPTAKLFYKYGQTDHTTVGATSVSSQFLGMMFRTPLD
jgi:hypothetical protein